MTMEPLLWLRDKMNKANQSVQAGSEATSRSAEQLIDKFESTFWTGAHIPAEAARNTVNIIDISTQFAAQKFADGATNAVNWIQIQYTPKSQEQDQSQLNATSMINTAREFVQALSKGSASVITSIIDATEYSATTPLYIPAMAAKGAVSAVKDSLKYSTESLARAATWAVMAWIRCLVRGRQEKSLTELLQVKRTPLAEIYPWVLDLQEEGTPNERIVHTLLQEEHLQWMDPLPGLELYGVEVLGPPENWAISETLTHHVECAHTIYDRAETLLYSAASVLPKDVPRQQYHRSFEAVHENSDIFARREQEVFGFCGVGLVFHPKAERPSYDKGKLIGHHGFVSVISNAKEVELTQSSATKLRFPLVGTVELSLDWLSRNTPNRPPISQTPSSYMSSRIRAWFGRRSSSWLEWISITGQEVFLSEKVGVLTTEQWPSEIWDSDQLRNCISALKRVLLAMEKLNESGGSCDTIPLLTRRDRSRKITTATVSYGKVRQFALLLSMPLQANDPVTVLKDGKWRIQTTEWCLDTADHWFGGGEETLNFLYRCSQGPGLSTFCLHLAALCAQMISVGLVTYCRGHCSDYLHNDISRPIEKFFLMGSDVSGPYLVAERVALTCLGDMLRKNVWVFSSDILSSTNPLLDAASNVVRRANFDVESTISELCDIWGGRILADGQTAKKGRVKISMGCGYLQQVYGVSSNTTLHWTPVDDGLGIPLSVLRNSSRVVVGATRINEHCRLTRDSCQRQLANSLFYMRAKPHWWQLTGLEPGIGLSLGGGPAALNASMTAAWTRFDGTTIKDSIISQWNATPLLTVLNEPWGLELSLCTGVARRVRFRELLDDAVASYLGRCVRNWEQIRGIITQIRSVQSDQDLAVLLSDTGPVNDKQFEVLREAVNVFLQAICHSRVSDGQLFLWWPEPNNFTPRGIKIDKSWWGSKNPWLRMLEDSERCAVFGIATTRCLLNDMVSTCPTPGAGLLSLNQRTELFLDTAISSSPGVPGARELTLVPGQWLVLHGKDNSRHVLHVKQVPSPGNAAFILDYHGIWSRPAIRLKGINLTICENIQLSGPGAHHLPGCEVVVRHKHH